MGRPSPAASRGVTHLGRLLQESARIGAGAGAQNPHSTWKPALPHKTLLSQESPVHCPTTKTSPSTQFILPLPRRTCLRYAAARRSNADENLKEKSPTRLTTLIGAPALYRVTGRYSSAARVYPLWHSRQTVNNTAGENFSRLGSLSYFGFGPDTNFSRLDARRF